MEIEALWSAASILRNEVLEFISKQPCHFDGTASIYESGVPPNVLKMVFSR